MIDEGRIKLYTQLYDYLHSKLYEEWFSTKNFEGTLFGYWKQYEDYILKYRHILKYQPVAIDEIDNILNEANKVKDRFQKCAVGYGREVKKLIKANRYFWYYRETLYKFDLKEISKKSFTVRFHFHFATQVQAQKFFSGYVKNLETFIGKAESLKKQLELKTELPRKNLKPVKAGNISPKPRPSTIAKHKEYVETYNHLQRIEKLPHVKAVKKTLAKYRISEKTLDRAIRENR